MSLPRLSPVERHERAEGRVGAVIGQRWRLDELLGVGGMASVYAATHRNGSRVALKMLHPELAEYPDLCERFLEEGYAANRVGPPGVVAVLDEGVAEDGAVYLVMELLRGHTLDEYCASGALLSLGEALRITDQILAVLERAHAVGVVHRDIKPENIFVTEQGELRLLDFGIARMADSQRTHQTEPGSAMGTPAFMPPEQARGRRDAIDERTDLWALGATLYWIVSGRYVHEAATVNEELLLAMTVRARSLADVAPHVPSALVRFVDRALEFDSAKRHPNASEMRRALRQVLDGGDHKALERKPSRRGAALQPPTRRALHNKLRTGVLAAMLSLLCGASWAWLAPSKSEPLSAPKPAEEPPAVIERPEGNYLGDIDLLVAAPVVTAAPVERIEPPPRRAPKKAVRAAARKETRASAQDPLSRRK
ncbi:MAG TPA: serine/threonine-protein kinase [Polyangiaceae bacterium]|nr:serine/threonine-protein kinase [Polyangiaceae bacterium]